MDKETRRAYIDRVRALQNNAACLNRDHMTICGFFDSAEEFERHIAKLEELVAASALTSYRVAVQSGDGERAREAARVLDAANRA